MPKTRDHRPETTTTPGPEIEDQYGLSPVQEGMLFHSLSDEHAGADIEQMIIGLPEAVDRDRLERAWQRTAEHHAALRTGFGWGEAGQPLQLVHRRAQMRVGEEDWRGLAAAAQQERLEAFLTADRLRGFDMSAPPLARLKLARCGETDYRLIWTFHHILLDGRSFNLILLDVFRVYEALGRGEAAELEARPPYRRYVEWVNGLNHAGAAEFWGRKLEGFTAPTPVPHEAHGRRGLNARGRYGEEHAALPERLTASLEELARREDLTMNTLVMGAWAILLSRYSGESDIVFGATKTARRGGAEGAEAMTGLLLNTLPVRIGVGRDQPALDVLKRLREEWLSLRAFENTPLVKIRQASAMAGSAALFDTLVVFEAYSFGAELRKRGGEWAQRTFELREQGTTAFTLCAYGGPRLLLKLEFDATRYQRATAERMLERLTRVLEALAADPGQKAGRIAYLADAERDQILKSWNATRAEYPRELCLPALFEAQCARTPENLAVAAAGERLTYAELNRRANRLAAYLRKRGAGPGALVGISLGRGAGMLTALLAVMKAGAAYVPLDPAFPAERLRHIAGDAGLCAAITEEELRERAAEYVGDRRQGAPPLIVMDAEREAIARESGDNPAPAATADGLAYVLYTSGSTGKPKGVEISQRALVNFLFSMRKTPGFTARDVLLAVTTISFDIAGLELYLPLIAGGAVALAGSAEAADGEALMELLDRHGATVMQATPATWQLLMESGWKGKRDLKALCGGEALPAKLAGELLERCGSVWNMYGPTETTIWSLVQRMEKGQETIAIGRPIANTEVFILDAGMQPAAPGVTGELYIGGDGLARGYHNRPDLTAEKFTPHPFEAGARLYNTGDLARQTADGAVECLGRSDFQVKVRGFRIELGEIETALGRHPAVEQSVAAARPDRAGGNRLAAYVVARGGRDGAEARAELRTELRAHLKASLPDYMVPSGIVFLDKLPLTPNGKVDRKSLPEAEASGEERRERRAPRTATESALAEIWSAALGAPEIGIDDDFFELGGHSLLAVRLFAKMRQAFPRMKMSLATLLARPTVARMAALLEREGSHGYELVTPIRAAGTRPRFFCIHGAGGNILSLRPLAMALPADLPFYAVQSRGLDGSEPFHSVEEAAARYVEEIRGVQAHGPYYLGGICYGGAVAFEMARRLEAQGEAVALVAMVDTFNFAYARLAPKSRVLLLNARYLAARTGHHLKKLRELRPAEWGGFFAARARALGRHAGRLLAAAKGQAGANAFSLAGADERLAGDSPELRAALERVIEANTASMNAFTPQPYAGRVTVFRATRQLPSPYSGEVCLGWDLAARGGVAVEHIAGDHVSVSEGADVGRTAEKLDAHLRAAEAAWLESRQGAAEARGAVAV